MTRDEAAEALLAKGFEDITCTQTDFPEISVFYKDGVTWCLGDPSDPWALIGYDSGECVDINLRTLEELP